MSKFEDNLWADLERDHGAELMKNTKLRRSMPRWGLVAAAAAAATVLGTGALVAPAYFGGAPPTSAVLDSPDDVTLTAQDFGRFEESTEKLRAHGIPAVVVPALEDCADTRVQVSQRPISRIPIKDTTAANGEHAIAIVRDAISPNAVLAIGMISADDGQMGGFVMGEYPLGQAPTCLKYLSTKGVVLPTPR